jgi:hypothetical protein
MKHHGPRDVGVGVDEKSEHFGDFRRHRRCLNVSGEIKD